MRFLHRPFRRQIRFTKEMNNLPRNVKLISLMMFVYFLGWGVTEPFLNIYIKETLGSYTALGIVAAFLPLFGIIWALLAAGVEDRLQKNKVISSILVFYFPISYIILILKSFFSFILFRFYHAFLATNLWLASETYLRKNAVKGKSVEAIGLFDSAFGLSLIIGPILGGILIAKYSYNIFYSISIFAVFAFLISLSIKDDVKVNKEQLINKINIKNEFIDFFRNKKLFRVVMFHLFLIVASSFIVMLLPLFYKELGASFFMIGLLTSLFYLPQIFESYFSTSLNKKKLFMNGLFFAFILSIMLFLTENIYLLLAITFLFGLCLSAIGPIIQGKAASCMPKEKIGKLYGVTFSLIHLASALGAFFAGLIADNLGLKYIFIIAAIIYISLFFVNLRKRII